MKKIIFLVLFLALGAYVGQNYYVYPCDTPITYRIDIVDPRFNLLKGKFIDEAKKAADIWNKAWGKEVLKFDSGGSLSVNLIYDERQLLNTKINNLEGQVDNGQGSLNTRIIQYKNEVAGFKARLADLNSQIDSWNRKGGAPPDVYSQLLQKQKDLSAEANRLNDLARSLNISTQDLNAQIGQLNQTVETFNAAIEQRPEGGIFIGNQNRIEVYFDITEKELVHTLAHEMGHAIGMDHVASANSVMYSKTSQVLVLSNEDAGELNRVCRKRSIFDKVVEVIRFFAQRFRYSLSYV